jgi:non-heme chloroperoxidase
MLKIKNIKMRDRKNLPVCIVGDVNKEKPIVVLVHGIGGSHHSWLPFAVPLACDYTFIIPNLRGFGLAQDVPYNSKDVITNFAQDIEDIIGALVPNDEKVILCGLSMGAYLSLRFLEMTNCARVSKYLNIDQSPKAMHSHEWQYGLLSHRQDYLMARMRILMEEGEAYVGLKAHELPNNFRDEYFDALGDFFECAFHRKTERFLAKNLIKFNNSLVVSITSAHKFSSYYSCIWAYIHYDYDFRQSLKKFDIPVSVFIGKNSVMYPHEGQQYIADNVPKLDMCVEFDEAHALMYTSPLNFYRHFKQFLGPR